jgi:membrane-associated protease RseP (regulator of RpoE activity)
MNASLKTGLIHGGLFLLTLVTTTMAGIALTGWTSSSGDFSFEGLRGGLTYSISFLFILTTHEFGHYFTAIYYRVKTSLPYYIPLPPGFLLGTMGAVIRIKDVIRSKQEHFDIGIAGPIAGFVAAMGILWYAFTHLPPPEYIYQIHPEYAKYGLNYAAYVYQPGVMKGADFVVGKNLIFQFFERYVADPTRMPNPHEIMHYPLLFAGFFSLVFTSLNLLPVGQLDGGHVLYGLLGYKGHKRVATVVYALLLLFAGWGFVNAANENEWYWRIPGALFFLFIAFSGLKKSWQETLIYALIIFILQSALPIIFPSVQGYPGWAFFLLIISRFVGIEHPQAYIEEPLTTGRIWLGWLALLIFILCFTPAPLDIIDSTAAPLHDASLIFHPSNT